MLGNTIWSRSGSHLETSRSLRCWETSYFSPSTEQEADYYCSNHFSESYWTRRCFSLRFSFLSLTVWLYCTFSVLLQTSCLYCPHCSLKSILFILFYSTRWHPALTPVLLLVPLYQRSLWPKAFFLFFGVVRLILVNAISQEHLKGLSSNMAQISTLTPGWTD